jgi:probable phosphoglycerate mutase
LDVPLNQVGKAQAKALAQRLKNWPVAAVYASDLKRAAMTAVYLVETWGLTPTYDVAWRERDVGVFEGGVNKDLQQEHIRKLKDFSRQELSDFGQLQSK